MKRRAFIKKTGYAGMILFLDSLQSLAQGPGALEESFQNPPAAASPYAYWFWMNGHISRQGITLDLEAMKETGIGGVFNFDVGTGIPQGPVEYFSDEWLSLKKFAMEEAARLGLEFTQHNCPGFSASGGPWIKPTMAMQQITWSESYIKGGKKLQMNLPKPASRLDHYKDIAVLAFPSLKEEELMQSVSISTNQGAKTGISTGITVHPGGNEPGWLQFAFKEPFEARMITFFIAGIGDVVKKPETGERTSVILQASNDGKKFDTVTPINTGVESELQAGDKYIVYDIPVTNAKYFRISTSKARRFRQVQFSGITRLRNWLEKTNARPRSIMRVEEDSTIETINDQDVSANSIHDIDSLLDLTSFTGDDGLLKWDAPKGNWTILRIGYTPTGAVTQAAPSNGQGLECDKYNREAMTFHFNHMLEKLRPLIDNTGKIGLEIDSYEAGMQNWTPGFEKEFEKRCGYSITKYLPILTGGRIIDNIDITERFTWDLRRVQADMMAENYYGQFHELCKQHNIISYIEPYDSGPMEEMQVAAIPNIAVGEFWYGISSAFPVDNPVRRTPKLVSSASQINNKQIVAAEAFTAEPDASRWLEYPFALKPFGDHAFTQGINRLIIHRFAHQPHPSAAPGMTMGPWGIHFDRTNTWWKPGQAWIKYLHRCQALLQQGHHVADLLYFSGEDANMYTRALPGKLQPDPVFDYDMIDARGIFNSIKIVNNRIVLANGASYALFVLQDYKVISLKLLQRLKTLVDEGMILVGAKPERSTGLTGYADRDAAFKKLANEIWGDINGSDITEHALGKGKVIWGISIEDIFKKQDISPDFTYESSNHDAHLHYTHRKINDVDIYFICNRQRSFEQLRCSFGIKNKSAEIWDAVTGNIIPVPVFENFDHGIRIPLQMEPNGSSIVVFRNKQAAKGLTSVTLNNLSLFHTGPFALSKTGPGIFENFTLSFWAKPESNILLQADFPADAKTSLSTEHFAVHPSSHRDKNPGYAACGVAVGRNGIAVWENHEKEMLTPLSVAVAIEGWSHIAVQYTNNAPSIFLNGKLLKKGAPSKYKVQPPQQILDGKFGFNEYSGDMTHPLFSKTLLSESDIEANAKKERTNPFTSFAIEYAAGSKPALLIKQNGKYQFNYIDGGKQVFDIKDLEKEIFIKNNWRVQFPPGKGAPTEIILPALMSLHHHKEKGVKYFSGTATWSTEFNVPAKSIFGKNWLLDLGQVEVIAEVIVNGKSLGILWKRPYEIDITKVVRPGPNKLEVKVTNLWVNRLIGDEQLPSPSKFTPGGGASGILGITGGGIEQLPSWYIKGEQQPQNGRITFSTWQHYTRDSPLAESGLIGPVRLIHAVTLPI